MNTMVSVAEAGMDRAWTTVPFAVASSVNIVLMLESTWGQITCGKPERCRGSGVRERAGGY